MQAWGHAVPSLSPFFPWSFSHSLFSPSLALPFSPFLSPTPDILCQRAKGSGNKGLISEAFRSCRSKPRARVG